MQVSLLKNSFYVDDFAGGAKNDDDAVEVYEKVKVLMKDGGFPLRKWTSNSEKFREMVAASEQAERHQRQDGNSKTNQPISYQDNTLLTSSNNIAKVLGLLWNVQSDDFHFDPTELLEYASNLPPRKRSV